MSRLGNAPSRHHTLDSSCGRRFGRRRDTGRRRKLTRWTAEQSWRVGSLESAHRWRPLRDSRIVNLRRGAAIRWSTVIVSVSFLNQLHQSINSPIDTSRVKLDEEEKNESNTKR